MSKTCAEKRIVRIIRSNIFYGRADQPCIMKNKQLLLISIAILFVVGACVVISIVAGSGAAFWFFGSETETALTPEKRPVQVVKLPPSPTSTATATVTQTPTPFPPTNTPVPTDTPPPPPPAFPFVIKETAQFPTNHPNFDVYVAIVNNDNRPLSDYRVIGTHSSGLQVESRASDGDWTVNSGANHYKGGNLKYEAPNSSTGVWKLQLVVSANTPVGPPIDFSFDAVNPTWYFIIYERQD